MLTREINWTLKKTRQEGYEKLIINLISPYLWRRIGFANQQLAMNSDHFADFDEVEGLNLKIKVVIAEPIDLERCVQGTFQVV